MGLHLINYAGTTYPVRLTSHSTNPQVPFSGVLLLNHARMTYPVQWNVLYAARLSTHSNSTTSLDDLVPWSRSLISLSGPQS